MLDTVPTEPNERAVMGGNEPPAPTALETWEMHAESLRERAVGIVITNDEQAVEVEQLVSDAKASLSDVQAVVKSERKPHMDAAAAVSEAFKPVLSSVESVRDAAVKVSGAWRVEQDRIAREAAAEARRIAADAEVKAARMAMEADTTDADDIAAVRDAENAAKVAKMNAKKASAAKVGSGGVRMMPKRTGEIIDERAVWKHINDAAPDELRAMLQAWVDTAVRKSGAPIPGVKISETKVAV